MFNILYNIKTQERMKSKYKIIDNFLDKNDFLMLKNEILNKDFSWYFQHKVNDNHPKEDRTYYFTHMVYNHVPNSPLYNIINNLFFDKLKVKSFIRIKCNCYPYTAELKAHMKHIDYPFKHKAAIFSLNTCNGFTTLEDGTKINSIENRLLLFEAYKHHASSNCSNAKSRFNINFNYF